MSRRVTIADVAREAGVSPGTVSRALNDYADVSADTRRRVQTASVARGSPRSASTSS